MSLVPFGERLWTLDGEQVRMLTIPFGTRMTVAQLPSGALWIHSPVAPTPERQAAVDALGPVAHLVAPNCVHSLGIQPWKERYPAATVHVSPRFSKRHPTLPADAVLGDEAPSEWGGELEPLVFAGHPFLDEVIFLHHPSRTLIVTDLIQRHDPSEETAFWRFVKGVSGILGEDGGVAMDFRLSFTDRAAARRCAQRVLDMDFDRLVVSHGMCAESGAKDRVRRALAWLKP